MKTTSTLALLALSLVGGLFGCRQADNAATLPQKEIALQLYSIRELVGDSARFAQNHDSVFALLSDMGYTAVEAANYHRGRFYGIEPAEFKAICLEAGLQPLSSHTTRNLNDEEIANHNFEAALQWWDEAIAAHKQAGMTYIVTPWGNQPRSAQEAATLCDYHNAIGAKCNEAGLRYGYHTHSIEFQKIPDTDTLWIDYMMENVAPENMFWQMDTYWAVMAGKSPVEYINKYPGRFDLLHIKDQYELGQSGMVNFEPIFTAAEPAGLKAFVVEQEGASKGLTVMESVDADAAFLRNAPFVKQSYSSPNR